eukprot:6367407-Prymnesium_polylepis.1
MVGVVMGVGGTAVAGATVGSAAGCGSPARKGGGEEVPVEVPAEAWLVAVEAVAWTEAATRVAARWVERWVVALSAVAAKGKDATEVAARVA